MHRTEISRRLAVQEALDRTLAAGVPAERREIEWLFEAAEGSTRARFMAALDDVPSSEAMERFEQMVARRMTHEPVQYILGEAEFYGRPFTVTPAVLIPRPETEVLVERVIEAVERGADGSPEADADAEPEVAADASRILDAGTGSGAIAVTVALEIPTCECTAFDISPDALAVARSNARRLGADVRFTVHDMLGPAPEMWVSAFDILVSNPPYIPERERSDLERQVADFEPGTALFAGEDPLRFYKGLARLGSAVLAPGGCLIVETHADHAHGVADIFEASGYVDVRVDEDLSGRNRIAWARFRPATAGR